MANTYHRIIYFDILRIIAIFFIINIHVIANFNGIPMNKVSVNWWWFGDISHSISRFSVPIFVMISGALLLNNEKENIKDFFKKRLFKVFIPFFFWSIIYILWQAHLLHNYTNINILYILKSIIAKPVYYHLWFVYMIIPLYLVTPIIKKMIKNLDDKEFRYLFLLWGITTSYSYISYFAKINISFNISYISGYIGYFILGYYLYKTDVNKRIRYIIYIAGFISLLTTIIGTYFFTLQNKGIYNQFMYDSLQPNIIIIAIAIFVFFKYTNFDAIKGKKVLTKLSNSCYTVYLIHPLVLHYLSKAKINVKTFNPLAGSILTDCLTMVICFLITMFLQRIPYISLMTTGQRYKICLNKLSLKKYNIEKNLRKSMQKEGEKNI